MRLATIFILLLLSSLTSGNECPKDWLYDHVFGANNLSSLADSLNQKNQQRGKDALQYLLQYYSALPGNMSMGNAPSPPLLTLVTMEFMKYYGWPQLQKHQLAYVPEKPVPDSWKTSSEMAEDQRQYEKRMNAFRATEIKVHEELTAFSDAVEEAGPALMKDSGLGWKRYVHNALVNYTSDDEIHECQIRNSIAYRVNNVWFLAGTLTNELRHIFLEEGSRKYLTQNVYIDKNGKVQSFPFKLYMGENKMKKNSTKYWRGKQRVDSNASETCAPRVDATSLVSEWGGRPSPYQFGSQLPDTDNIAILAAMEKSKDLTKQAHDTRTVSNTAILVFPIFLTTLPLALFADVSDSITLWYVIFTDILTVLPLAIKGVELLQLGVVSRIATRTMVYGYNGPAGNGTLIAETWSVKCKPAPSITVYGAVFVSVAVFAMLLGIVLEFVAHRKLQNAKKLALYHDQGIGIEYLWSRDRPCVECECDAGNSHTPNWSQASLGNGLIGHMVQKRA